MRQQRLPGLMCLLLGLASPLFAADDDAPKLKAMTFNIRYLNQSDGENHWDKRKDFLVEVIRKHDPDLLGSQENTRRQLVDLAAALPDYQSWGVGREDGAEQGEAVTIYYRADRFEKQDGGHFWLSETPDVPGSQSWDAHFPRMASWLQLKDLQSPGQPSVWVLSTHFDHRGAESRRHAARLIREWADRLGQDAPVVVMGDFNAIEGSPPYTELFAARSDGTPLLVDAYRAIHSSSSGEDDGTINGFQTERRWSGRIDWIACTPRLKPINVEIDRVQRDGRYPSDHFPVIATLRDVVDEDAE